MSRYRKTMSKAIEEVYHLNEITSHTVRFTDPANKKRFAIPFKTHSDAEKKMAQLKRDGVTDIEITMDNLKSNIVWKEEINIKKIDGKKGFDFKGQFITDPETDPTARFKVDPKKYYGLNDKQLKDLKEDDDHEVSMARGELEATADKAIKLSSILKDKMESGNPIEAWVQSKITKAAEMIATVHDYMVYNPEVNEEAKEPYGWTLVSKAKDLAKKFAGNMTKAYAEIEKLQKGLSNNDEVQKALKQYNEEKDWLSMPNAKTVNEGLMSNIATLKSEFQRLDTDYKRMKDEYNAIMAGAYKGDEFEAEKKMYRALKSLKDVRQELSSALKTVKEDIEGHRPSPSNPSPKDLEEGIMKDIYTMDKEGASVEDIAKKLNLKVSTVKNILGEQKEPVKIEQPEVVDKKSDVEKTTDAQNTIATKDQQIETLKGQVALLKQKIENEKNKAIKPEPNPKTGEVPLTIGIAYREFKKQEQDLKKEVKENVSSNDKQKRLQRANDMIKYYDAVRKKELKGPNKELAKKILKTEDSDRIENDPCWKGYKMVGKKMKNGKEVPNCVPEGAIKLVDNILSNKLKEKKKW